MVTNKKKFKIPDSLLKQIDECSFGGYILFNFSSKGEPQVFTKFDNQINAMKKTILTIIKKIKINIFLSKF
ncbi:MAG: hypothetical protein EBR82_56095 [Caulobacteraceae bacterium]|nr:hypothetical protein [Caulobacteraceae bacterium]